MDKLGITQRQNIVETTVEFPGKENIEFMDGWAIIKGLKIVEPNVGFSWKRKD